MTGRPLSANKSQSVATSLLVLTTKSTTSFIVMMLYDKHYDHNAYIYTMIGQAIMMFVRCRDNWHHFHIADNNNNNGALRRIATDHNCVAISKCEKWGYFHQQIVFADIITSLLFCLFNSSQYRCWSLSTTTKWSHNYVLRVKLCWFCCSLTLERNASWKRVQVNRIVSYYYSFPLKY